ncbi:glycosyltransferase [Microbacterium marinilacus]|uniref:D-inositol 3-phosphate glycosyltransferase n=1 Tax=Microbacterium marinilacus TaxID=415209 RepID=A0ABP7BDD1_9MICO|nr:glycosyltransferase [Microbacterium marinilacus]MBY0690183.1 glycosyltransferase [Microbacterium marinilacus]
MSSNRPRILHVTECYAGGVSRAIETIVRLTPEAEHHLLWRGDEEPADAFPYASRHDLPEFIPNAISRVKAAVDDVKPDLVYAHSSWAGVFTRAVRLPSPVVYAPHCYKFDDVSLAAPLRVAFRLAERALAPRTARTVVLSPHEEALAHSLGREVATHYVPNIATLEPDETHPATGFETARDVIMIGRLSNQKDPAFFADVARIVRAQRPDVTFRWIGDGEDDRRALLEDAGVEITGWVNGEALAAELSRPSLYFHTAIYEGFPLSVLDAAAFEHPVAARGIPAFDELGIPQADSAEAAAVLVLDILEGNEALGRATEASRRLRATMNGDAQRRSLQELFAAV